MKTYVAFERYKSDDLEIAQSSFDGAESDVLQRQFLAELSENRDLPTWRVVDELFTNNVYWFVVCFEHEYPSNQLQDKIQATYDAGCIAGLFEILGSVGSCLLISPNDGTS